MENGEEIKIRAARWICAALLTAAIFLALKYAGNLLMPFVIAYGIGAVVYPLSKRLSGRTHLPRKLCAFIILFLLLAAAFAAVYFSAERAVREIAELVRRVREPSDPVGMSIKRIFEFIGGFSERLSLPSGVAESVSGAVKSAVGALASAVSEAAGRIISKTPSVLFGLAITVIAAFYMSLDMDKVNTFLLSLFPKGASERIAAVRARMATALRAYLRAYLLIFLLTFTELFIGLMLLRRQYALLIALCVAAIDLLPVFGAGAVLLPWAVISFIMGNSSLGCGLLVLYGVVTVVRQIAEPKIVGKGIGVHPLGLLFCMFVSLRFFGFLGLLLSPAIALLCKELILKSGAY